MFEYQSDILLYLDVCFDLLLLPTHDGSLSLLGCTDPLTLPTVLMVYKSFTRDTQLAPCSNQDTPEIKETQIRKG